MTIDKAAQGRSSNRRGDDWERATVQVAHTHGFPYADRRGKTGAAPTAGIRRGGDMLGMGDRIIEATVRPLADLALKMRQAEGDALRNGWDEYWIAKRAPREPAERGYLITRLEVGLPLLAELDRLRLLEFDVIEAEERGYRLGVKAAKEGKAS